MLGIKDMDMKLMNELDDKSLGRLCQTDSRAKKICDNDEFWRRRIYNIFGNKTNEVLKAKKEGESFRSFYTSERFHHFKNKAYPLCIELEKLPHSSQMVIDDFYNPNTGIIANALTRGDTTLIYLILKIVYSRLLKDGGESDEIEKLEKIITESRENVPEYGLERLNNTFTFDKKDNKYFLEIINIGIPNLRIELLQLNRNKKLIKSLRKPAESFKLITTIHYGFVNGQIPLDIKWDELCTLPYLFNNFVF